MLHYDKLNVTTWATLHEDLMITPTMKIINKDSADKLNPCYILPRYEKNVVPTFINLIDVKK